MLEIEQAQRDSRFRRKFVEQTSDGMALLFAQRRFQRVMGCVAVALRGQQAFQRFIFRRFAASLSFRYAPRPVAGDGAEPSRKLRRVLQLV